mmetsp:Transcript_113962/g.317364  ORF Transcript_113962/g.317364 Transcript_113962/m.317364 type:complete len:250 (-) Transcript_113962:376-1125(-)
MEGSGLPRVMFNMTRGGCSSHLNVELVQSDCAIVRVHWPIAETDEVQHQASPFGRQLHKRHWLRPHPAVLCLRIALRRRSIINEACQPDSSLRGKDECTDVPRCRWSRLAKRSNARVPSASIEVGLRCQNIMSSGAVLTFRSPTMPAHPSFSPTAQPAHLHSVIWTVARTASDVAKGHSLAAAAGAAQVARETALGCCPNATSVSKAHCQSCCKAGVGGPLAIERRIRPTAAITDSALTSVARHRKAAR